MRTSRGTEALIELENAAPDALFATLPTTNVSIWPQVRMKFANAMAETELNTVAVPRAVTKRRLISGLVKAYLPDRESASSIRFQKDYCFITSGVTVSETVRGMENWLVGPFADEIARQSVIIQDLPLRRGGLPGPAFRHTFSLEKALSRVDVNRRLAPLSEQDDAFTRHVIREIASQLPVSIDADRVATIESWGAFQLSRSKHVDAQYSRILDRVKPKVVFMEDASYGSRASVISLMKERGILVVEPQHGWIGPSHGAYNFGAAMTAPPLAATMPDVLMTFGEFWSSIVRHPGMTVAVGKPQLERMAAAAPPMQDRPREVLVVSSVSAPDEMARFTLAIRDALPAGWMVRFRPHPSERPTKLTRYEALVNQPGILFDEHSDVYTSLSAVRGVVGVASTVLYEALAMGCHVFVKESPLAELYMDHHFGNFVSDNASLSTMADMLNLDTVNRRATESVAAIWKPNAIQNFLDELPQWRLGNSQ